MTNWVLNICKDRDSTSSIGNLLKHLITLMIFTLMTLIIYIYFSKHLLGIHHVPACPHCCLPSFHCAPLRHVWLCQVVSQVAIRPLLSLLFFSLNRCSSQSCMPGAPASHHLSDLLLDPLWSGIREPKPGHSSLDEVSQVQNKGEGSLPWICWLGTCQNSPGRRWPPTLLHGCLADSRSTCGSPHLFLQRYLASF